MKKYFLLFGLCLSLAYVTIYIIEKEQNRYNHTVEKINIEIDSIYDEVSFFKTKTLSDFHILDSLRLYDSKKAYVMKIELEEEMEYLYSKNNEINSKINKLEDIKEKYYFNNNFLNFILNSSIILYIIFLFIIIKYENKKYS